MKRFKFSSLAIVLTTIAFLTACQNDRNLPLGITPYLYVSRPSLEVNILNTESSNFVFIEVNDDIIMIDLGFKGSETKIFEFLTSNKIDKVDYLLITQINELSQSRVELLSEYIDISQIISHEVSHNEPYTLNLSNIEVLFFNPKQELNLSINDAMLTIYPHHNHVGSTYTIASLEYLDQQIIFASDVKSDYLDQFLLTSDKSYTVAVLPSDTLNIENIETFLLSDKLTHSIFTCFEGMEPDMNVLQILNTHEIKPFLACDGTVSIRMNNDNDKLNVLQQLNKYN